LFFFFNLDAVKALIVRITKEGWGYGEELGFGLRVALYFDCSLIPF